MRLIPLSKGYIALVDDEDFEALAKYQWRVSKCRRMTYACRWESIDGRTRAIWMHRAILNTPPGFDTDHRSTNGLDNQRSNLRVATKSQNQGNKRKLVTRATSSQYKGVRKVASGRWEATIGRNGRNIHLGTHDSEAAAASAYDAAAREQWGEYARTNA